MRKKLEFVKVIVSEDGANLPNEAGIFGFTWLSIVNDGIRPPKEFDFHIGRTDNVKEECLRLVKFIKTKGIEPSEMRLYYRLADANNAEANDYLNYLRNELKGFLPVKEL